VTDKPAQLLPPGLALAWGVTAPGRRGPKPAHSVERIVELGIELGDTGGFEAISLQRIAGRLGMTTNAMYRYVSSKEELIVLVAEAAFGPPPDAIQQTEGWRAGATAWVHAMIERYGERPWLLDVPIRGAPVTPNMLHWTEVLLHCLDDTGLSRHDNLGCVLLLDGYARSYSSLIRQLGATEGPPVESAAVAGFLLPRLKERGFLILESMLSGHEYEDTVDDDLDFGLTRILDGIDHLISTSR
jgi:AcrR family transcriptional regulator